MNALRSVTILLLLAAATAAQTAVAAGQDQPPPGTRELDDITYVLADEWVIEDVKGPPDLRAHYVYKARGRPYGEFYLSTETLDQPKKLEQILAEGIEKGRKKLNEYRPMGTRRTKVGALDVIVHDFGYHLGTNFRGRVYAFVVNKTSYTFFFNTVNDYFPSMTGRFSRVVNSVKVRKRPQFPPPGGPDGKASYEEHGLVFDLPAGWRPSGSAAGAKYRCHGERGRLLASFFPLKSKFPLFEHFGPLEEHMEGFVKNRQKEFVRDFKNYAAGPRRKLKIGDLEAHSIEFTFDQERSTKGFFRWYYIPLKDKEDEGSMEYPYMVRQFGFYTVRQDRLEELKSQFEAIVKSIRRKAAEAPAGTPAAGGATGGATPTQRPAAGALPALEPEPEDPGLFRDPAGRFKLPLPAGAAFQRRDGDLSAYTIAAKGAKLQVWALQKAELGTALVERIAQGKQLHGQESKWDVCGKEARVRLYTAKNEAGKSMATVTAFYPEAVLVLVVELPAASYGASQAWITALFKGLSYKD